MRHILVEIVCRHCAYHTHIKSHTLVKPELEPQLRERILQGKMFTFQCPSCYEEITFIHNFLYHDTNRKFLVYMSADKDFPEAVKEQFPAADMISVKDPEALREAICILEDGLHEQTIQIIKQKLMEKDQRVKAIRYHDQDIESHTIWFDYIYEGETVCKAIHRHVYDLYDVVEGRGENE